MSSSSFSLSPPTLTGENYPVWAVKMKAYLRGLGVWQYVEENRPVPPLGANPTLNQTHQHEEEASKAPRSLSHIHAAVSDTIFTRIMDRDTPNEVWDRLKDQFAGNERTKRMQVLNLKREFEVERMQEAESIKDYTDRLLRIVNKLRLLGEKLEDTRVVEKVLVRLPERFESKISSLEDSRDLSEITISELIHALQAQEVQRSLRNDGTPEGAFAVSQRFPRQSTLDLKEAKKGKNKGTSYRQFVTDGRADTKKGEIKACPHCKRSGHAPRWCWYRPEAWCKVCDELGHTANVCKKKREKKAQVAQAAEGEEKHLFTVQSKD